MRGLGAERGLVGGIDGDGRWGVANVAQAVLAVG